MAALDPLQRPGDDIQRISDMNQWLLVGWNCDSGSLDEPILERGQLAFTQRPGLMLDSAMPQPAMPINCVKHKSRREKVDEFAGLRCRQRAPRSPGAP